MVTFLSVVKNLTENSVSEKHLWRPEELEPFGEHWDKEKFRTGKQSWEQSSAKRNTGTRRAEPSIKSFLFNQCAAEVSESAHRGNGIIWRTYGGKMLTFVYFNSIQHLLIPRQCVHYWKCYWKWGTSKTKKLNYLQTKVLISAWTASRNLTEWYQASSPSVWATRPIVYFLPGVFSESTSKLCCISLSLSDPWTPNPIPRHSFCLPASATISEM